MRGLGLRSVTTEQRFAVVLALAAAAYTVAIVVAPGEVPFTPLMIVLLLGTILLSPRVLPWFAVLLTALVTVAAAVQPAYPMRTVAALVVMISMCLIVLVVNVRRSRLGIGSIRGETMLVDLRDRILAQGAIPELPHRWLVESALSSAGGSPFAGDFVVATTRQHGTRLEVAVVDVSGKGEAAGTRALQLSGAMGGLLGALPPERFLPAANAYLLAREWEEGFATAVHLSLDLTTGDYELRTAGHPPPAHRAAGSGRWHVLRTEGPVLGLLEDVQYDPVRGRLEHGDALLLYTDGMVEEPRRDIELGIDGMLGAAESLIRRSFEGLAQRLAASVGSSDDDRALLLVHRT